MRKLSKTLLSLLLIAAMSASFFVLPAAAEEPAAEQPTEAVQAAETQATDSSFMKIFHLDCGRKYFTKDWILALINEISAAGYTHLQLAIGNDGMRFLLDDMSLTVGDKTYSPAKMSLRRSTRAMWLMTKDRARRMAIILSIRIRRIRMS